MFLNGNDINTVKHCGVESVFWEVENTFPLTLCLDSKLGINQCYISPIVQYLPAHLEGFFTLRFALMGLSRYQVASKLALSNYFRDWGRGKKKYVVEICLEVGCWRNILIKEVTSNWQTIS